MKRILLSSLIVLLSVSITFAVMSREMAPVIVKGENLPAFNGFDVTGVKVMAYSQALGTFAPIPFQLDEFNEEGFWMYSANGAVDDSDEIVFMAKDAGDQIIGENIWPADQQAQNNRRYEIAVYDPYSGEYGYVYVFYSGTLPQSPTSYISYNADTIDSDVYTLGHNPDIAAGLPTDLLIKGNDVDFLDSWRVRVYFNEIKVDADTPFGRMTVTAKDVFFSEHMNEVVDFKNSSAFLTLGVRISTFQNGDPFVKTGPIRILRANPFGIRFKEDLSGTDQTANIYMHTIYYPNYSEFHPAFSIALDAVSKLDTDWIAFSKAFDLDATNVKYYAENCLSSDGTADSLINASTSDVHRWPISETEWPGTRWYGFSGQGSSFVNDASLMTVVNLYGDRIAPDRDPNTFFYDHRTVSSSDGQEERTVYGVNGLRIYDWAYPTFDTFALEARIRTYYFQENMSHYEMENVFAAYEQELTFVSSDDAYIDTIPPANITDLAVIAETDTSVTLSWTAPGDDGMEIGPVAGYIIRYSPQNPANFGIWNEWWGQAMNVPATLPTPAQPGTVQTFTIYNLEDTGLYFAMRAGDDADPVNWNALSNFAATSNATVPVELASFTAVANRDQVTLNWVTASESNNYGFEIQRSNDRTEWIKTGFVQGAGTTNKQQHYEFTDSPGIGNWYYRLQQIDTDGSTTLSDAVLTIIAAPSEFALFQNYPNPFNPGTTISYEIPQNVSEHVSLVIYDLLGRLVIELVNGKVEPGTYRVAWNGEDMNGMIVGSGVYILRMQAPNFNTTRKMIKLQ